MKVQELYQFIETEFVSSRPQDTIGHCLDVLRNEHQNCIAVIENKKYIGSIHIEDLIGLDIKSQLKDITYLYRNCHVVGAKTTIDFLRVFAEQETDQVIILNENFSLYGSLLLADFLAFLSETPFLAFSGEEIIVQKNRVDFTYAEIAQIIESNGAKLLGIFTQHVDADQIQISFRIDHNGINEILQNLRRYDYEIISFHKEDHFNEKLKDYSDYFDKYLNI